MNLYQTKTKFNCGIDLHGRNMYACVMDSKGKVLIHHNIKRNDFDYFLRLVDSYRSDLTVACESTFNWYWLADACKDNGINFVLGHALYMKAIHGTKTKNDRVDSKKIAHLLRSNMLPEAYCCSVEKRPIRDLLRRRIYFVRQRAQLLGHLSSSVQVYGQTPLSSKEKRKSDRKENISKRFTDATLQFSMKINTDLVDYYDIIIKNVEKEILGKTRLIFSSTFNLLKTAPGVGEITALIILYETDKINRFSTVKDFSSYSMLIPSDATSNGKKVGSQGRKMGNHYLKWAFTQAAVLGKNSNILLKKYADKLTEKHGKCKGNAIYAHRLGIAVYYMLKNKTAFDLETFLNGKVNIKKIREVS
jgi:transposase